MTTAEYQAITSARSVASGATVYLNMEPSHSSSIDALIKGGISRVVIGLQNPLPHIHGKHIEILRSRGLTVDVLGSVPCLSSDERLESVVRDCAQANEALLHRVGTGRPFSVLKYAMTLDGKIAAPTGHSAWVSSPDARKEVFATRAKSDAVIVGGNTVRRDNPNLTTRREGGATPMRIVMSRTLELPLEANLWNVSSAPTIVMTQRGARVDFQQQLRDQGVDVVEFDFLTPMSVVEYCYDRGFLQLLWECGGTLAAPAMSSGVIHKIMAFIAPKIIGGDNSPTPCGDLGFVEMTQAVKISDLTLQQIGPDVMLTGYCPSSGGLMSLTESLMELPETRGGMIKHTPTYPMQNRKASIEFYKTWDQWGDLSNFNLYPIRMFFGAGPHGRLPTDDDLNETQLWSSVEHYYQSQKFAGSPNAKAKAIIEQIKDAENAEEASKIGRANQQSNPSLLRSDWFEVRVEIMREALRAKFQSHEHLRQLLISTAKTNEDSNIIEVSPHDFFWGCGFDGSGKNQLGELLMSIREELILQEESFLESQNSSTTAELYC
eukprot:g1263.t1